MMKKLLCLGSVIAMILAAQGCDRNNIEPTNTSVKWVFNIDSQTRTILDGKSVVWEKDDTVSCVTVYTDERLDAGRVLVYSNIHPTEINGKSAKIELTCGSAFTPKYIVYPSNTDIRMQEFGKIEIPVSESYTMVPGNLPKASNIAVGAIEGDNVMMRNAMAMMKFEVDYPEGANPEVDGIKQFAVQSIGGEALGGSMTYDVEQDYVIATNGSSKVFLYLPEDELYFPEGVYYFPLPAIELSQGLKVKVSRMDDFVAVKSYDEPFELVRNSFINMGKTSEWGLTYENTSRVLFGAFSTLDKVLQNDGWAFTGTRPSKSSVCGKGLVGPYFLPDNDDAEFYFYVATSTGDDSWRRTGGAGHRFGGTVHDYMLFPALEGYRLVSVFIQAGTQASTYAITDNPATGEPTVVEGGDAQLIAKTKNYTWNLSGTEENTAYRLDLPTTTPAGFIEFQLTYEKD